MGSSKVKLKLENYRGKVYFPQLFKDTIVFSNNNVYAEPSHEVKLPKWLLKAIDFERQTAYEEGIQDSLRNIRKSLGLEDSFLF